MPKVGDVRGSIEKGMALFAPLSGIAPSRDIRIPKLHGERSFRCEGTFRKIKRVSSF
jgi:hypothetical protein